MSSRHTSTLAPEWFGYADAVATEAKAAELSAMPADELLPLLERWASDELKHAIEVAAENMYAAVNDNGDEY